MKGLPCPCLALPHFWQMGPHFMAEAPGTPTLGKRPQLSISLLQAQYEGKRRQQQTQTHLVVLPTVGRMPAPDESMVSAIWINKERQLSLSLERGNPDANGDCHQMPGSPWHTHLEMYRFAQTSLQEPSYEARHQDLLLGSEPRLPWDRALGLCEHPQVTLEETKTQEAAQQSCQVDRTQTQAEGTGLYAALWGLPSLRSTPRSGKPAHYPFPQRKVPRISQLHGTWAYMALCEAFEPPASYPEAFQASSNMETESLGIPT